MATVCPPPQPWREIDAHVQMVVVACRDVNPGVYAIHWYVVDLRLSLLSVCCPLLVVMSLLTSVFVV